eukprot:454938-Pyramimonas_sp.AAC.2
MNRDRFVSVAAAPLYFFVLCGNLIINKFKTLTTNIRLVCLSSVLIVACRSLTTAPAPQTDKRRRSSRESEQQGSRGRGGAAAGAAEAGPGGAHRVRAGAHPPPAGGRASQSAVQRGAPRGQA